MVQTVKNLLKKVEKAGEDPYIVLLNEQTTPVSSKLQEPSKTVETERLEDAIAIMWFSATTENKINDDKLLYLQRHQETQHQQHGQKHRRLVIRTSSCHVQPILKDLGRCQSKDNIDEPQSYDVKTAKGSELRLYI